MLTMCCRGYETHEARDTLTFSQGLKEEKREVRKMYPKHICMWQNSNRKPSILCTVHVWCDCNEYKRKIITNTGTSLGCVGIFSRLRLVVTKLMLKSISWKQAWDAVKNLRFRSYLQICLLQFKIKSDATQAEGGCRVSQYLVWSLIDERVHTWLFNIPITQCEIQEYSLCLQ